MVMSVLEEEADKATTTLLDRGFRHTKRLFWLKPYKEYEPTQQDIENIEFLCISRDMGGLAGYMITEDKAMEFSLIVSI